MTGERIGHMGDIVPINRAEIVKFPYSEEDRKRDRIEAEIKHYKGLVAKIPPIDEKTLENGYKDIFFNDVLSPEKSKGSVGEKAAVFLYVLNDQPANLKGDEITEAVGIAEKNIREYITFDKTLSSDERNNLKDFYELTGVEKGDADYLISLNNYDRLSIAEQGIVESMARNTQAPEALFAGYMAEEVMQVKEDWLSEKLPERENRDICAVKAMALIKASEDIAKDTGDIAERKMLEDYGYNVDTYALQNFDRDQLITYLNRDNDEIPFRFQYEKDILLSDKNAPKIEGFKKEYDRYIEKSTEGKELSNRIEKAVEVYAFIQNTEAQERYEEAEKDDRYIALMRSVEMIRYEAMNDGDDRTALQADDLLGSISYHQTVQIPVAMRMADTETLADEEDIAKAMEDIRKGYPGDELKRDEAVATVLGAISRDRDDDNPFPKAVKKVLDGINEREEENLGKEEYVKFLIRTRQMTSEEYLMEKNDEERKSEDIEMPEEVRTLSDIPIDERIPEARKSAKEYNDSLDRNDDERRKDEHDERDEI